MHPPAINDRKELYGIIICLVTAMIFGLYIPSTRGVYQEGGNVTFIIIVSTFCRMLGLYAFALLKGHRPFGKFREYKTSLFAGIFQATSITGILGAAFFLPGPVVIIIVFTYSLMLLLFSAWKREIKLNLANVISTLTALIGLGLVLGVYKQEFSYSPAGIALAFMAAIATFARMYIFGKQSESRHPLVTGAETFTVALVILLLLVFWELPEPPQTLRGGVMAAITCFSLTLASFGMFYGVAYLGSYKASMYMKMDPAFTTIFGVMMIGDYLDIPQYIGIGLVIMSLFALQIFDRQKS